MTTPTVRDLQQRLLAWGFDIGPTGADGILGPKTKAALQAAQKRMGLPVTGTVTPETVAALSAPPPPMQAPRPNMRPPPDVLNANPQPNTGMPPIPQMRTAANVPPPDQMGSGNTNVLPRLRPGEQTRVGYGTSPMPANFRPRTEKFASDGNADAWLPLGMQRGARTNSMNNAKGLPLKGMPPMGLSPDQTAILQSLATSSGPKGWQNLPFLRGIAQTTPADTNNPGDLPSSAQAADPQQMAQAQPQSLGAMSAAANGVLSGNQPAPGGAPDSAALDQVKAMLWQMMAGARIQAQPGQPARQDLYSTATQPPRLPLRY